MTTPLQRHGSCSAVDCGRSHDVTVAVLQEEHTRDVQRLKRKRKRGPFGFVPF